MPAPTKILKNLGVLVWSCRPSYGKKYKDENHGPGLGWLRQKARPHLKSNQSKKKKPFKNPIASLQTQVGSQIWLGIKITRGIFKNTDTWAHPDLLNQNIYRA
jgi:hypothetical protein